MPRLTRHAAGEDNLCRSIRSVAAADLALDTVLEVKQLSSPSTLPLSRRRTRVDGLRIAPPPDLNRQLPRARSFLSVLE